MLKTLVYLSLCLGLNSLVYADIKLPELPTIPVKAKCKSITCQKELTYLTEYAQRDLSFMQTANTYACLKLTHFELSLNNLELADEIKESVRTYCDVNYEVDPYDKISLERFTARSNKIIELLNKVTVSEIRPKYAGLVYSEGLPVNAVIGQEFIANIENSHIHYVNTLVGVKKNKNK